MKEVLVSSSLRSYKILLGENLIQDLPTFIFDLKKSKKIFVISDEHVFHLHGNKVKETLEAQNLDAFFLNLPRGEKTKSFNHIQNVYSWLVENRCDRHSVIIALGGGVIGDAVGFIAATYLRGVTLVQMPTTLLSMVDSSIGGKVGINLPSGKNMVGAFYPPHLVIQDISFLKTLEKRELSAGLAECIKHALISSKDLFVWTKNNKDKILSLESTSVLHLISQNLEVKKDIVQKDEKEENIRAFLNLGHTFGHALEKAFAYSSELLHGEGVALGLIAALHLSTQKVSLNQEVLVQTIELLQGFNLPTRIKTPSFDQIHDSMMKDKKNKENKINFVLLADWGQPVLCADLAFPAMKDAYQLISS